MPRVHLFAPAYPPERLQSTLADAEQLACELGWDVLKTDRSPPPPPPQRAPAGLRAADLRAGDGCDWLWALRGGYGCSELLAHLADWRPRQAPRLLGFSDLTVLHGYWSRRGWPPGIYGLMPGSPHGPRGIASLRRLLAEEPLHLTDAEHPAVTILRPGRAAGPLFVACLRVLASMVGGPALPDLTGRILCLEDIDEAPYAIDRDLRQLHLAGALRGVVALVGGSFPCDPPRPGGDAAAVLATWAEELDIPALFGLPFGHNHDPLCLPQETPGELRAETANWSLNTHPSFH